MIYVHYDATGAILSAKDESCFRENPILKKRKKDYTVPVPEEPYIKVTPAEWQSVPGRKVTRKVVDGKLVVTDLVSIADYDQVMEQHIHDACVARGYTTREPDAYLNSRNERWAQDAEGFIDFRDKVMEYGLMVQNEFVKTGKAPSLEVFKAGLPQIEWTIQ